MSSAWRHAGPVPIGLVGPVVLTLAAPPVAVAQSENPTDATVRIINPSRTIDAGSLPPVPLIEHDHPRKPFHPTMDAQTLKDFKQLLRSAQGGLRTTPRTVSDPLVGASGPLAVGTPFEGLANLDNAALLGVSLLPPDSNLGVGPNHVFEMV